MNKKIIARSFLLNTLGVVAFAPCGFAAGEELAPSSDWGTASQLQSRSTTQRRDALTERPMSLIEHRQLTAEVLALGEAQQGHQAALLAAQEQLDQEEAALAAATKKMRASQDLIGALAQEGSLLSRLTGAQVSLQARLSNIAYEASLGRQQQPTKAASEARRKYEAKVASIKVLETTLVNAENAKQDVRATALKQIKDFMTRKKLGLGESDIELKTAMIDLIAEEKAVLAELEATMTRANDAHIAFFQSKLGPLGAKLKVQAVFMRNSGEISGFAAYDEASNELQLVFAGTKSWSDAFIDLCGWNRQIDPKYGCLRNINVHSGFAGAFEQSLDSILTGVQGWLEQYKRSNHEGRPPLKLLGTGHSLGGALAELATAAAVEIAQESGVRVTSGVVTFGAPSILHAGSIRKFQDTMGGAANIVQIEDSRDPVPLAIFWKDHPGVRVSMNIGLFHDTTGAFTPVMRNPHSGSAYYHGAQEAFEAWKLVVAGLQTRVDAVTTARRAVESLRAETDAAATSLSSKFDVLMDADQVNADSLQGEAELALVGLTQKKVAQEEALKKRRAEIRQEMEDKAAKASLAQRMVEIEKLKEAVKASDLEIQSLKTSLALWTQQAAVLKKRLQALLESTFGELQTEEVTVETFDLSDITIVLDPKGVETAMAAKMGLTDVHQAVPAYKHVVRARSWAAARFAPEFQVMQEARPTAVAVY